MNAIAPQVRVHRQGEWLVVQCRSGTQYIWTIGEAWELARALSAAVERIKQQMATEEQ